MAIKVIAEYTISSADLVKLRILVILACIMGALARNASSEAILSF
jgi:hypothetical protein